MFFQHYLAPTQWSVGDYSPLKEYPGRGPAARRIFFNLVIKINDLCMKITIVFDIFRCIFDQISMTIMKIVNIQNIFEKLLDKVIKIQVGKPHEPKKK